VSRRYDHRITTVPALPDLLVPLLLLIRKRKPNPFERKF
jgi:hypothetical protein